MLNLERIKRIGPNPLDRILTDIEDSNIKINRVLNKNKDGKINEVVPIREVLNSYEKLENEKEEKIKGEFNKIFQEKNLNYKRLFNKTQDEERKQESSKFTEAQETTESKLVLNVVPVQVHSSQEMKDEQEKGKDFVQKNSQRDSENKEKEKIMQVSEAPVT